MTLAVEGFGGEAIHEGEAEDGSQVRGPGPGRTAEPAGEGPLAGRSTERHGGPEVAEDQLCEPGHALPTQRWIVSMKAFGYSGGIADASSSLA